VPEPSAQFITGPRPYGEKAELALTTEPARIPLSRTGTRGRVYLSATQNFHFEPDPDFEGEWKVKTDAYAYHVLMNEEEDGQLIAWHWHPEMRPGCHVHVGARQGTTRALYRFHLPTGRVSIEEVFRFLIEEFHVEEVRDDWDSILSDTQTRFEAFRTWPGYKKSRP